MSDAESDALFLGIDCSTQAIKCVLIDDAGALVAEHVVPFSDARLARFGAPRGFIVSGTQAQHFCIIVPFALPFANNSKFDLQTLSLSFVGYCMSFGQRHIYCLKTVAWWRLLLRFGSLLFSLH